MKLIQPTAAYAQQIAAYRQAFLDAGDSLDGSGALRRLADPYAWLQSCEDMRHPERVPAGYVQATQFIFVREEDDRLVGMLQVRHTLSEYLQRIAGHIGYSVRPDERRRGYAKAMWPLPCPFAGSWDWSGCWSAVRAKTKAAAAPSWPTAACTKTRYTIQTTRNMWSAIGFCGPGHKGAPAVFARKKRRFALYTRVCGYAIIEQSKGLGGWAYASAKRHLESAARPVRLAG